MKRTLVSTLAVLMALSLGQAVAAPKEINVLGQPMATGLIQKNKEQQFFENFAQRTGVDVKVNYKPLDVTGFKAEETLRLLKSGLFDVVAVRMAEATRDEPFFLGMDLAGMNPNYKTARDIYGKYKDAFDKRLQERFNARLMGMWVFGPQVLWSNKPIGKLEDIKGMKVRVGELSMSKFMQSLGAVPVVLPFAEIQQGLSKGLIDAAVTGASSGNTAGLPEVSTHFMPLGFLMAYVGYGFNEQTWKKFTPDEQKKIAAAFDRLTEEIWTYSETLHEDAVRCTTGKTPCETVKPFKLKEVPVTEGDLRLLRKSVVEVSYPAWAPLCDKSYPDCTKKWKELLGPTVGVK